MTTLLDLLKQSERGQVALRLWDKYDFKVMSPISIDDLAEVKIWLINRNRRKQEIILKVKSDG
jgi:hypothetical protein